MEKNPRLALSRWQKACLILTLVFSVSYLLAYFQRPSFIPTGADSLLPVLISLLVVWSPLGFFWMGLHATSSISASILGFLNLGAGLAGFFASGYPKVVSVLFLLVAAFYYFYSTKTWKAYEAFWFNAWERKAAGH
jgi:uncharacterized membrane protein YbaN (DUF454 family)